MTAVRRSHLAASTEPSIARTAQPRLVGGAATDDFGDLRRRTDDARAVMEEDPTYREPIGLESGTHDLAAEDDRTRQRRSAVPALYYDVRPGAAPRPGAIHGSPSFFEGTATKRRRPRRSDTATRFLVISRGPPSTADRHWATVSAGGRDSEDVIFVTLVTGGTPSHSPARDGRERLLPGGKKHITNRSEGDAEFRRSHVPGGEDLPAVEAPAARRAGVAPSAGPGRGASSVATDRRSGGGPEAASSFGLRRSSSKPSAGPPPKSTRPSSAGGD
jgi:hypothetical protein